MNNPRRLEIASVDDFATHHDIVKLPRAQVFDMLAVTSAAQVSWMRSRAW
jgi:hypothetical protein